jgi:hypothetical protein
MSTNQRSSAREALLQELLAAIKADIPVARGWGGCAEPSFRGSWLVMDKDCAERVKKAAAALRQSTSRDSAISGAGGRPASEALLQELLAAIEANKPLATGTGPSPDVPIFDRHDSEAESRRPGWELVDADGAKRVKKAAAALSEAVEMGL